jgi:formate dehydrogenase accessory protein FdhE
MLMEDRIGTVSARWLQVPEKIGAWLGDPRLSEDYLRFRMDLARAYAETLAALASTATGAPGSGRLKADDVNFDPELLRRLFFAVIKGREQSSPRGEAISRLIERTSQDSMLLPRLARIAIFAAEDEEIKTLAEGLGLSVIDLLPLGRLLAAPFIIAAVAQRPPAVPTARDAIACPACGSAPLLARLRREDGKRRLVCSICHTEWSFPRIMCPCCRNAAESGLTVLSLVESEARWIEVCEQCRHYIKTIDERKLPEGDWDPFVEESITLPLDLLAEREGYIR